MSTVGEDPGGELPRPPLAADVVLAALARAQRQRVPTAAQAPATPAGAVAGAPRAGAATRIEGVSLRAIVAHLGAGLRSGVARSARVRLRELEEAGSVERTRTRGVEVWSLTARGRRRLQRLRARGAEPALPESPQHRAWREARLAAQLEIDRFAAALRAELDAASAMLAADPRPPSDAWFELAERLRTSARRLGSAQHLLHEWPEPDEGRADVDERVGAGDEALSPARRQRLRALRAGRRNVRLWRERDC